MIMRTLLKKLKRENVGMPLAVFIERNNMQYNTDLQILR